MLWVLGEGEVPHWCYVLNVASHARGVLPLAAWSDAEHEASKANRGSQSPRGGAEGASSGSAKESDGTVQERKSSTHRLSRTSPRSKSGAALKKQESAVTMNNINNSSVSVAGGGGGSGGAGGGNSLNSHGGGGVSGSAGGGVAGGSGNAPQRPSSAMSASADGDVPVVESGDTTSPRNGTGKTPLLQKLSTMRASRKERRKGGATEMSSEASFPGIRLRVVDDSTGSSGASSPAIGTPTHSRKLTATDRDFVPTASASPPISPPVTGRASDAHSPTHVDVSPTAEPDVLSQAVLRVSRSTGDLPSLGDGTE